MAIYDPQVSEEEIRAELSASLDGDGKIEVCTDPYDAVRGAHATAVLTEWNEFADLDFASIYEEMLKPAFIFDGRNILDLHKLRAMGFVAHGVGKR